MVVYPGSRVSAAQILNGNIIFFKIFYLFIHRDTEREREREREAETQAEGEADSMQGA